MQVPSFSFLAAAVLAALLHGLSSDRRWRSGVLLVLNLGFLLTFTREPLQLAPYAAFLLLGFAFVRRIGAGAPACTRAAFILAILAGFFWLKRYSFLPDALFLPFSYLTVGLSYVFFRVLHLALDAREDPQAGRIGLLQYLNYTLNFTALVSGPIQRFQDYQRMTGPAPAPLGLTQLGLAAERIVAGLFKFTVLAAVVQLAQRQLAATLPADPRQAAACAALLTAAYPVYLFFNFSGYTSFVIGVARLFRISLPENFNQPFRAPSFIEYWSRWHMSLSNWLKAYVYNPLLLHAARRVRNPKSLPYLGAGALFVTFFLIGVWHGRTWNFFVFGVLNGAGVALNQAYRIWLAALLGRPAATRLSRQPLYVFVARGLTFSWVAFTLLWFWSDWPELSRYAHGLGAGGLTAAAAMLILGGCVMLGLLQALRVAAMRLAVGGQPLLTSRYVRTVWATLMLMVVLAVTLVTRGGGGDIVYKGF